MPQLHKTPSMSQNLTILFLREMFTRMGKKSPFFFVILQWISSIALAVTGIPAFLADFGVHLSGILLDAENKGVAIGAAIALFVSMMPVQGDTVAADQSGVALKQTPQDALPFTARHENDKVKLNAPVPIVPIVKP